MGKTKDLLAQKAKNIVLAAALMTGTGAVLTSCGSGEELSPEQEKAQTEQKRAMTTLERIEKAGIPTVKKDKEGNITELLSGIDEIRNDVLEKGEIVTKYKYENPQYMSSHVDAHQEVISHTVTDGESERIEKHCRAVEYSATPERMVDRPKVPTTTTNWGISLKSITLSEKVSREIDEHGDTIVTQKKNIAHHCYDNARYSLGFKYKEKQPVNAKANNLKMQKVQRRGSRNS